MKVLVACEESQEVCKAFRARGHEAYSCDIQEPSGGHPEWHILGDALKAVEGGQVVTMDGVTHDVGKWDLLIAHPPCTHLAVSGARWFTEGKKPLSLRFEAAAFFMKFAETDIQRIAIENPVCVMSTLYRKAVRATGNGGDDEKMTDIEKSIAKLQRCFPGSYITDRNELIVHPRTNQYIILENIGTEDAIKAKVLEWLSRAAFKTTPYSQEWRNRKFHKYMRDGINAFLDTDFSEDDMELIYTYMGLACDRWLTLMFIDHDMSIEWLKEHVS